MRIDFVRFSDVAIFPTKGSSDAAGFDLYFVEDVLVPSATVKLLRTDIGFNIPKGYFGKIHPRSSFALRFTDIGGWVIDADYRDPVSVILSIFLPDLLKLKRARNLPR